MVLRGRRIGTGACLGAGSVVTKDVPPYAVVAGNPARLLRYRFPDSVISVLPASRWWNLPNDAIAALPKDNIDACVEILQELMRDVA